MSPKTFILGNLAILAIGGIGGEAIANPEPNPTSVSTFPRWSSEQTTKLIATPRWSDIRENNSGKFPQWLTPRETDSSFIPQWSNASSDRALTMLQWFEFSESSKPSFPVNRESSVVFEIYQLPHIFPSLASPKPHRDAIAQKSPAETTIPTSIAESAPSDREPTSNENGSATEESTSDRASEFDSPVAHFSPTQPTGEYLGQGEVSFNVYNRLFFPPDYIESPTFDSDTGAYPNLGLSWGITDNLQLSFEFHQIDSGTPGRQGEFEATRNPGDDDYALEIKQKLWENPTQTLNLSGVLSLSWGDRDFRFTRAKQTFERNNSSIVPVLQFPFTASVGDRWRFTVSPTVAFFDDESAVFYHRLPIDDPGSFGTTFGFAGAISFQVTPQFVLWGDVFFPLVGNNSISRESGKPDTAIGFNAGLRYLINPRLAFDIFASNTQGNKGPLALTADRDLLAVGAGVVFMPDFIGANRRHAASFGKLESEESPLTTDGLGFLDGGTLNGGQFQFLLQAGVPGISTALRYGFLKDFEGGIYLDYTFGDVDESEQGFSAKIRFLNQTEGAPLTASLAFTLSQTNKTFINFFKNDRDEFRERGLEKNVPLLFNQDSLDNGQLNIVTVSLPLNYQFDNGIALWLTPTWGYVQRMGTEIAGVNAGGAFPISRDVSLIGEIGANFVGDGNAFIGDSRDNAIPWTFAVRWDPSSFLGFDHDKIRDRPFIDLFLTNRVGSSPWHQLRVRDQDRLAIGVGLSIPF
jgi:hypothetical protein